MNPYMVRLTNDCYCAFVYFSAISHDKATEEVSKFDKSSLKHTETEEKNPLPDKDGNY